MDFTTGRADLDRVVEIVSSSKAFRDAEASDAARLLADRRSLASQRAKLISDREAEHRAGYAAEQQIRDELRRATMAGNRVSYVTAQARLAETATKNWRAASAFDGARDHLEAALIATAPAAIDAFLNEVRALWGDRKRIGRFPSSTIVFDRGINPLTGEISYRERKLAGPTAAEVLGLLRETQDAALELRFEPDPAQVEAEISRLRAALPAKLTAASL